MILADDILAARGTECDLGGIITSLAGGIEQAERFVLSPDIAMAGYNLIRSRPVSLLSAMPMCRLPYRSMWIEWEGATSTVAGWDRWPGTERNPEDRTGSRPIPQRMGCLIEAIDDNHQRGSMTWAWKHADPQYAIHVCGLGVNFDWSEDGDVVAWGRASLTGDKLMGLLFEKWVAGGMNDDSLKNLMLSRDDWRKLANDPQQIEALRGLLHHEAPWFTKHGRGMLNLLMTMPDAFMQMLKSWEGDIAGEAPFISAIIMMMNSQRAVEHERNDLSKLNKARQRRGKPILLPHSVTRLHLSHRRIANANAHGMTREQAREHLVRGHFKIRKSGIYWWHPFMRGDADRPMNRKHYEVAE